MRRSRVRRAVLVALLSGPPAPAVAQEVGATVAPDTVRVGDVFRAAVRVVLPPGYRAEFPDSLPLAGDVEQAGRRRETADELPDGGRRITVVYPLSAWRPGPVALPAVSVRLAGPGGERTVEAALPELTVRSILPSEAAGVLPRGLKDVLGASRTLWPLVLALLVGIVAVGGVLYWRRRGREAPLPAVPPIPPRELALAALDRARELGLVEAGRYKAFYSLVTEALRAYLAALDDGWGAELTTTELLGRVERVMLPEVRAGLARLLRSADLVKFARRRPTPAEAIAAWEAARAWVLAYGQQPQPAGDVGAGEAADQEVA